jgi:hypothetical protein
LVSLWRCYNRMMSGYREMGGLRDMSVHREVVAFERWVNIGR